jgi:hypothetical protein
MASAEECISELRCSLYSTDLGKLADYILFLQSDDPFAIKARFQLIQTLVGKNELLAAKIGDDECTAEKTDALYHDLADKIILDCALSKLDAKSFKSVKGVDNECWGQLTIMNVFHPTFIIAYINLLAQRSKLTNGADGEKLKVASVKTYIEALSRCYVYEQAKYLAISGCWTPGAKFETLRSIPAVRCALKGLQRFAKHREIV